LLQLKKELKKRKKLTKELFLNKFSYFYFTSKKQISKFHLINSLIN